MTFTQLDDQHMARAIELARRGEGCVEPNPMVGCVIVEGERIIAEGWHHRFGDAHAEVVALREVPEGADMASATMYVSLEPCCHAGKTPACTDAIIASGLQRVMIAMQDPFPRVDGGGIKCLRAASIKVGVGCGADAAQALSQPYTKRVQTGIPWMIAKWAMTLDGKIATAGGDSQWISSEPSREIVHQIRGRVDAIMVGRATAQQDDPLLTARPSGPRTATRIVVDRAAKLSADSKLVTSAREVPVLVACSMNATATADAEARIIALRDAGCEVLQLEGISKSELLVNLLQDLGSRAFTNVLVEGGGELLGSCLDAGQIDELHAFIAPKLIGGANSLSPIAGRGIPQIADAVKLSLSARTVGDDTYLFGRRIRTEDT